MATHKRKSAPDAKKKKISLIIKIAIIVGMIIVASVIVLTSPIFNISSVVVEGNKILSSEQIVTAAALPQEGNVFLGVSGSFFDKVFLTFSAYKNNLTEKYVEIKSVDMSYSLGGKVTIVVHERTPFAYIPSGKRFLLVDTEGVVLKVYLKKPNDKMMIIFGMKISANKIGDNVGFDINPEIKKIKRLLSLFKNNPEIPKSITGNIIAFNVERPLNLEMLLLGGKRVLLGDIDQLGDPDVYSHFKRIKVVLESNAVKGKGVLDYSTPDLEPFWSPKK